MSAAALLALGVLTGGSVQPAEAISEENLLFLEAWRAVDRAYVDKSFNGQSWFRYRENTVKKVPMVERDDTYQAIRDMLATLDDPFTRFLEPTKYEALMGGTAGSITGVGLEVGFEDAGKGVSQLTVVSPNQGSPAEKAGIQPGDALLSIGGKSTATMGLYDAASELQGPEGSTVTVTTRHPGAKDSVDYKLTRATIDLIPVSFTMCPAAGGGGTSKVGMIRLSTFNSFSAEGVRKAIGELKQKGAEAFVLDVRNNGGGLFPAGVEISKMFLNRGVIVNIADTDGVRDIYEADGTAFVQKEPVLIVVNKGTASASEVMAGALKDNSRATILGEQSFGKGLIQTIVPLSDGSAVVVTVARYQTPSGEDINKIGITPDWRVDGASLPLDMQGLCGAAFAQKQAPSLFGDRMQ